jgi:hypothetical protein
MYAYAFGYRDDRTFHFCLFNQYKTYSGVFKDAFDMCLSDYIYGVKGTMDRESALAILNERMNNGLFRIYIVGL